MLTIKVVSIPPSQTQYGCTSLVTHCLLTKLFFKLSTSEHACENSCSLHEHKQTL